VRLEGLGKLKKSNDLIGIRIRDLPACSIVFQPTTLLRAPAIVVNVIFFYKICELWVLTSLNMNICVFRDVTSHNVIIATVSEEISASIFRVKSGNTRSATGCPPPLSPHALIYLLT
jgi:hypothetical protein